VIKRVLGGGKALSRPWPVRLLQRWPKLARIPARVIGIGFQPEHVRSGDYFARY
jgi:hypothetical protein